MVRRWLIVVLLCVSAMASAQEVLVPVAAGTRAVHMPAVKALSGSSVPLPFFDDFSDYTGMPQSSLWEAGGGSVGVGFAPLPPTVGAMTLDAYDAYGSLYPQATTSLFPADTVTSLPLRLDSMTVDDSLVLSFYYLPGGGSGNLWERVGDSPEGRDSLLLEFYADSAWHTVWSTGGVSVDSLVAHTGHAWQYVALAVVDSIYFDSTFRFRFRNYCSLEDDGKAGRMVGGDQWNIDYVLLDRGRVVDSQPVFRDIAFVDPAPSMLATYRAMPARQYRTADMATNIDVLIANLYTSELASHYSYAVMDGDGDTIHAYDGGYENAPAAGYQTATAHAHPPVGFSFPTMNEPCTYTVVHSVREGAGGDTHQQNDTIRYEQRFDNYFAFDDGSAENGYGITSTASRIYLAYRFDLNVPDTLTAVDMYFNRTYQAENEDIQFYITVWSVGDNGQPDAVLYHDEARRMPTTGSFGRYLLERAVVVSGSIYVGFEQVGNKYINLGFDRSLNSCDRIWYRTSNAWQQSILSGSLMLRPCFGSSATVATAEVDERPTLSVRPTVASSSITIAGATADCRYAIYDLQGRSVMAGYGLQVDVSALPEGVYLLLATDVNGATARQRIIIRH